MSVRCIGVIERAGVADHEAVHDVGALLRPADHAAAVRGVVACDGNLHQAVLDERTVVGDCSNAAVRGIAGHGAVDGDVNIAAAHDTLVARHDTAGELAGCGDGTRHLQVLDDGIAAGVAEEACIYLLRKHVDFDGVACTFESALVAVFRCANHGTVDASVNVGREHGIGVDLTIIYELSKRFEVCCRTNLIDASHIGECPCSCADDAHQRCQTQIQ